MPTNRRRKDDPEFTPFQDPVFRRHSVHFDNLEFQRRFEQNLIRYGLVSGAAVTKEINDTVVVSGGGGAGGGWCYWEKVGSDLVYYKGTVGVGVHALSNDFEVRGNVLVEAIAEQPYVEIRNWSDTAYDPVLKWSVGATPACMFAMGVDDSDGNKLKIANQAALGSVLANEFEYGSYLFYFHESQEDIVSILLSDFDTDAIVFNGSAGTGDGQFSNPRKLAFDGTYLYIADDVNNRIQKFNWASKTFYAKTGTGVVTRPWGLAYWGGHLYASCSTGTRNGNIVKIDAETLLEVSTFGTVGTGNDNFNGPRGLSTDGTYLYICDTANTRLKKHTLAGVYVAQVGSSGSGNGQFGGSSPCDVATDGTYVWVCDYGNKRIQIFNCSNLSWVASITTFSQPTVGTGSPGSVTINGACFYVGCNNSPPYNGYIEKYDMATNTLQDIYYAQDGVEGTAPDVIWGMIILKYPSLIGDLIILHQDGTFLEVYPKTKFMDDVRLYEGVDPAGRYVGLRAPTTVTADYTLTLPAAVAAAQGHLYGTTAGVLAWGQDVNAAASPTFVRLTLSQAIGTAPLTITSTTLVTNLNADLWDGYQFSDYLDQAVKVASSPTFGGIIIANGGTIGQAAGPLLNFDDTNNYLEISGCNVGIGTTAPGEILDIVQNCPNNDGVFLRVYESGAGGTVGKVLIGVFKEPGGTYSLPGIWFGTDAPSYTNYVFLSDGDGLNQIINTPAGKNIKFRVNNADIMAIIGNTGCVGINDIAPGELLDVNGNINLTGVLKIDDVQVLKEQQAAIADPSGGGVQDAECRAQLALLLAAARTHGFIAT